MLKTEEVGKEIIGLVDKFVNLIAKSIVPEAMERKDAILRGRTEELASKSSDDYAGQPIDDDDEPLDDYEDPFK